MQIVFAELTQRNVLSHLLNYKALDQGRPRQLPDDPLTDPCVRISRTGLFKTARFAHQL